MRARRRPRLVERSYIVGPPRAGLHGEVFGWIGLGSRWRSVPNATLSVGLSSDFTTNFPKKPPRVSPLRVACRRGVGGLPDAVGGLPDAASVACPTRHRWPARRGIGGLPDAVGGLPTRRGWPA